MKERIFDMTITPSISSQNVHVLNYWKYELKDTLGLNFNFKSRLGTIGQDPFGGYRGNALKAFFTKFTPEYVIKTLTQYINDKKEAVCKLMDIIDNDNDLNDEQKIEMGVDIENGMSDKITEKAVEYYLIKDNILIKLACPVSELINID